MIHLRLTIDFSVEDYVGQKAALQQLIGSILDVSFEDVFSLEVEVLESDEPANVSSLPGPRPANRNPQSTVEEDNKDE